MKKRAIKNKKHRIAKARRIVRRKGDDWAGMSNKQFRPVRPPEIGNCYPLDTPDEVIIKEQKLIPQAMHRLKMAAKKAWFEFNGSEGPDWRNGSQRKHNIYYSHDADDMCLDSTWLAQEMMGVYFPTKKSAQAYIHNNLDNLRLLFGVE